MDDFETLARKAAKKADWETMDRLWQRVFDLPVWAFINRGTRERPMPFIGMLEGKPFIMAFTDGEQAERFAGSQGLDKEKPAEVLGLAPPEAVEFFSRFKQGGVFGVLFNPELFGFFSPLENLLPMLEYHNKAGEAGKD